LQPKSYHVHCFKLIVSFFPDELVGCAQSVVILHTCSIFSLQLNVEYLGIQKSWLVKHRYAFVLICQVTAH